MRESRRDRLEYAASRAAFRAMGRTLSALAGLERRELVVDGVRTPVLVGRRPARSTDSPLVCLHGFGSNKESWLTLAPLLARKLQLVIPDLPGFGEASDPAPSAMVSTAQAAWVQRLLDTLGLGSCHIAGHSMGGAVSLRLAERAPDRVRSLVLVAAAAPVTTPSEVTLQSDRGERPLVPRTEAGYDRLVGLGFGRGSWLIAPFRAYLAADQIARADRLGAFFERWYADYRQNAPNLAFIGAPALVLHGARDRLIHAGSARDLAAGLPDARHLELEGIGHMPQLEAPLATARAIKAFVASVP